MGGIQSQAPAPRRSGHPWGASRVRSLPQGGVGTPGGCPESDPCPREEWEPLGGVQSQVPAPGRSGHPWGASRVRPLPWGGAGALGRSGHPWGASRVRPLPHGGGLTLGASAHMGSVPEETSAQPLGSLQDHLPRVRLSQERVGRTVAHPVQVWALVSATAGCTSPLNLLSTNQPSGRRDPLWADRAVSQADLPLCQVLVDFPSGSDGEESACDAGDLGLIPGLGRTPGEGNGNPLRCSGLANPMDRGAWWATLVGSQRVGHDRATNTHTLPSGSASYIRLWPETCSTGQEPGQVSVCPSLAASFFVSKHGVNNRKGSQWKMLGCPLQDRKSYFCSSWECYAPAGQSIPWLVYAGQRDDSEGPPQLPGPQAGAWL